MGAIYKKLYVSYVVLVCLFLSACVSGKPRNCGGQDKAWTENLALWQSKKILDYDMVVERYHDPMYGHVPFLIKVRNGKNISMEPSRENLGLEKTDGYEAVNTVEQMFDTMKSACERGDTVNVTYDPILGVPTFLGFSNIAAGPDKADGFKVEKFSPVVK